MRDSDLDQLSEHPSEEEVLAPRVVDSLSDHRTPEPQRRRTSRLSSATTPLLLGTALAVVVVIAAGVLAVSLILSVWVSG